MKNTALPGNSGNVPFEPADQIAAAPLESIVCTQELRNRPSRPPEYEKENRALTALASALADSPATILQTLADKVLELLHAESAGLSLLTKDGKKFYWAAVAGAWGPQQPPSRISFRLSSGDLGRLIRHEATPILYQRVFAE